MTPSLAKLLDVTPVVPLIQVGSPDIAIRIVCALAEGGLNVVEVVLRTPGALDCLRAVVTEVDDVVVGAGTVLDAEQAQDVIKIGAKFIVSPGLDEGVVATAKTNNLPLFAGVSTASEVQRACNLGLGVVKFFPASLVGGIPMLKTLSSVFGSVRFMPTGGISAANLSDFLALPSVLACGGSWITPADAIASGDYAAITRLAREAVDIAGKARS